MSSILITGAGGFIGASLTTALLASNSDLTLTVTDISAPPTPSPRVTSIASNLTDASSVQSLLSTSYDTVYLLHGIMSSGSEANLPLSTQVNIDSFRLILQTLIIDHPGTKLIFPSSLAVYGPCSNTDGLVCETTCALPQSSYGTQKLVIETLINDYSRRGLIDGRIARLPTVIVRPGAPTAAASSFASGIVREPLQGIKSSLPVSEDLEMWVCSPQTVVANLMKLRQIPSEKFAGFFSRVVCLPGQVVSVGQILTELEAVGGREARNLVVKEADEAVETIVKSWPSRFDVQRAEFLGLQPDVPLREVVQSFARSLKE
ncbi:NAD(P)-binding protein [Venturia nashicola]|nr:NAD(P)-binding protein [Venturia nashicola]